MDRDNNDLIISDNEKLMPSDDDKSMSSIWQWQAHEQWQWLWPDKHNDKLMNSDNDLMNSNKDADLVNSQNDLTTTSKKRVDTDVTMVWTMSWPHCLALLQWHTVVGPCRWVGITEGWKTRCLYAMGHLAQSLWGWGRGGGRRHRQTSESMLRVLFLPPADPGQIVFKVAPVNCCFSRKQETWKFFTCALQEFAHTSAGGSPTQTAAVSKPSSWQEATVGQESNKASASFKKPLSSYSNLSRQACSRKTVSIRRWTHGCCGEKSLYLSHEIHFPQTVNQGWQWWWGWRQRGSVIWWRWTIDTWV